MTVWPPSNPKGIWHSRAFAHDKTLVITESPIDALSYHELRGSKDTRYISVSGQASKMALELTRKAMERMPSGGTVVLALDNDAPKKGQSKGAGDVFAERLAALAPKHVTVTRAKPEHEKDWNDVLRAQKKTLAVPLDNASPPAKPKSVDRSAEMSL
jgi:hypothetical protein